MRKDQPQIGLRMTAGPVGVVHKYCLEDIWRFPRSLKGCKITSDPKYRIGTAGKAMSIGVRQVRRLTLTPLAAKIRHLGDIPSSIKGMASL